MSPTLIPDVAQLRHKLSTADGDLAFFARWVEHVARQAPADYPWYQPWCAVVTGEPVFAAAARATLLDFARRLPERDATIYVQYHHWAAAAPIARYGLYYDWVADRAPFTAAEHTLIRQALLDYGLKHLLPALQTKHASDHNNQVLSLALGATMIGWVYGHRRGPSALGERLLETGLARLTHLFDLIPAGGWSGEGSSYMHQIFVPGLVFAAKLLGEITGQDWLRRPAARSGATVLDALRLAAHEITPGGMLLPWDHHGFSPIQNFSLLAVLAAATGEREWLALARQSHAWGYEQNLLWGYDDKVWTLLWWPDAAAAAAPRPAVPRPWLVPTVGGALVSADRAVQVVQAWDVCGDAGLATTRMHVNPNTLLIEAFGAPLTTDGSPTKGCTAMRLPGCQQTVYFHGPPQEADWSVGTVGAHSCLIVDDEVGHVPGASVHGTGLGLAALPGFQVVSGDATVFYQQKYGATRVVRSTVLLDERVLLVLDTAEFTAPHTLTWRAYLRPEVTLADGVAHLRTSDGVAATLAPLSPAELQLTPIPGFPNTLEQRSCRLDCHYPAASTHHLATVLVTAPGTELIAPLADAWHFRADPADSGLAAGWAQPGANWAAAPRLPVTEPWVAFGGDARANVGWYARQVELPADTRDLCLRLHRHRGDGYRVWLDGVPLTIAGCALATPFALVPPKTAPGPHWLVLRAVHTGQVFDPANRLSEPLANPTFWGEPALVRRLAASPAVPAYSVLAPHWLQLAPQDLLLHDNHRHQPLTHAPWRSDARHARLAAPQHWSVADATLLQHDGQLLLTATAPATLAWHAGTLTLAKLPEGGSVTLHLPASLVQLTRAGALRVTVTGADLHLELVGDLAALSVVHAGATLPPAAAYALAGQPWPSVDSTLPVIPAESDTTKVVNSNCHGHRRSLVGVHSFSCVPSASGATTAISAISPPLTADLALTLASARDDASLQVLLAGLQAPAWPLRSACALALGRRGQRTAVPALLAALEREATALIRVDPATADSDWPGFAIGLGAPLPLPSGEAPDAERVAKRWRLKVTLIEALGALRDPRAVAPLCTILSALADDYPVLAAAARALGTIGDPAAIPSLTLAAAYYEACTHLAARAAIKEMKGE